MKAHDELDSYNVTAVSVPRSRSNGLWNALIASTDSAAGSGLAGSSPGQPISDGDMFGYDDIVIEPLAS